MCVRARVCVCVCVCVCVRARARACVYVGSSKGRELDFCACVSSTNISSGCLRTRFALSLPLDL